MKKYDYIDRVLFAAVVCDMATEASLGSAQASRSVWVLSRLLGGRARKKKSRLLFRASGANK